MAAEMEKVFFASKQNAIEQITIEINGLPSANERDPKLDSHVRAVLGRLYHVICELQEHERDEELDGAEGLEADRNCLKAWYSLLDPINVLAGVGKHGHFLAARMMLFALRGFFMQGTLPGDLDNDEWCLDRVKIQTDFSFAGDEALLALLREIWKRNREHEEFRWATSHIMTVPQTNGIRSDYNETVMKALSPAELWQIPGAGGKHRWARGFDDEPTGEWLEDAIKGGEKIDREDGEHPSKIKREDDEESGAAQEDHESGTAHDDDDEELWEDCDDSDEDAGKTDAESEEPARRQLLFSDGSFCLVDDYDKETWLKGCTLRRSRQFILDARQANHHLRVQQIREIARDVVLKPLPMELRDMVLAYIEAPDRHPYLSHLDLAEIYAPFPPRAPHCNECTPESGRHTTVMSSCPNHTVHVWNLGLRTFHSIHPGIVGGHEICRKADLCLEHHSSTDFLQANYVVTGHEWLRRYTDHIFESRCNASQSPDKDWFTMMTAVDPDREWVMPSQRDCSSCPYRMDWPSYGFEMEKEVELHDMRLMGGRSGVLHAMLHQDFVVPSYGRSGMFSSYTHIESTLIWARTEQESNLAAETLRTTHAPFCTSRR